MNAGILIVAIEMLEKLLHLPEGVRIERIDHPIDTPHSFRLRLTGPGLPEVLEGDRIPEVIGTVYEEHGTRPMMEFQL